MSANTEIEVRTRLARTALDALEAERPELRGYWIDEKRRELADANQLEVLRWICSSLDEQGREIVASALEVSEADLLACRRVLCKI